MEGGVECVEGVCDGDLGERGDLRVGVLGFGEGVCEAGGVLCVPGDLLLPLLGGVGEAVGNRPRSHMNNFFLWEERGSWESMEGVVEGNECEVCDLSVGVWVTVGTLFPVGVVSVP